MPVRPTTFPREKQQAKALGERLRLARRRRRISLVEMAARVGVSAVTQRHLEQGDPSVSLAALIRTLAVLQLSNDLDRVADDDELGRRLADSSLPVKPRRSRPTESKV